MKTKHLIILIVLVTVTLLMICLSFSIHKDNKTNRAKIVHTQQAANTLNLITTPSTGQPPLSVNFTVGCSNCIAYTWDFGDNSGPAPTPGPTQTHMYQAAGTYYPIVAATDKNGLPYVGQGIVTVGQCGPPKYCANTSLDVIQQGTTPSLPAQNAVSNDPNFNTQIIRATDAHSCRSAGFSQFGGLGGSADVNTWNVDESKLFVEDTGANGCVLNFDKVNKKFSTCAVNVSHSVFDYSNPSFVYQLKSGKINKIDLTDCSKPVITQIYDLTTDTNCNLPVPLAWQSFGGANINGQTFTSGFSARGQDTGLIVSSYTVGKGCRNWNTATGVISGTGITGTITIPDRFTIHNVKSSPDGKTAVVAVGVCLSTSCRGPYVWTVDSINPTSSCKIGTKGYACGGHWVAGNSLYMNNSSVPWSPAQWVVRPYTDITKVTSLISPIPPNSAMPAGFDSHSSWPNENNPMVMSTIAKPSTTITTWAQGEIIGVGPTPGPALRFGHHFATFKSPYFSCTYAIGTVSPSGNYYMVTSDWNNTLGTDRDGKPRCDVFVYDLRTAH